jgi:hypothetical protein
MAVELLGANAFPHVVIVAVIAYVLSGHRGIYPAQRLISTKDGALLPEVRSLGSHSSAKDREPPS